mgnify:FL=1
MSIRHFTPKRKYRKGISDRNRNFLIAILGISIIAQIATIAFVGSTRITASMISTTSLALFCIFHAQLSYGTKYASLYFLITVIFSIAIETINVVTGWPFGEIIYSDKFGAKILGTPLFVIIGWLMMVHPILVLARQISKHWIFFFGGLGLAAWDLFLDPVMVKIGYWEWRAFSKSLPLVPAMPISNTFGWLLSGMALMGILNYFLPKERRKGGLDFKLIVLLLSWNWVFQLLVNIFVFQNYGVALIGGIGFGILLIPLVYKSLLGDV